MGQLTFESKYRKGSTLMRIYILDGSAEELALYKEKKGTFYREGSEGKAKGKPLFFTSLDVFGTGCKVKVTANGNVVEDSFVDGEAGMLVADSLVGKMKTNAMQEALAKRYVETGQLGVGTQQRSSIAKAAVREVLKQEEPVKEEPAGAVVNEPAEQTEE